MKLVILDRDGVINEDSESYIKSPDEWRPLPGSLEAITRLNHAGFRVAVATNQSGLARGLFDMSALNAIHEKMRRELAIVGGLIDGIYFCPHGPNDGCDCRKPATGLLRDIEKRYRTSLDGIPIVGDSFRDIQSAKKVSAAPMLVRSGKGEQTLREHEEELVDVPVCENLATAADLILSAYIGGPQ